MYEAEKELKKMFPKKNILLDDLKFSDETTFKFEDLEEIGIIGSGTFGKVCEYVHQSKQINIAIKFVKIPYKRGQTNDYSRLVEEAKIHLTLPNSHNIIKIYGISIRNESLLFYMESMDNSLEWVYKKFHEKLKYFSEELLHYVMMAVVNGLDAIDKVKIMHRNLKPSNILVNWNGEIKLCDFGAAKKVLETL